MEFEEKTLSRKEIYQGPIFKLVQDQVELPEGKGTAQRDLIFHNGAVCVLAVTDEQKLILVKQYRKAIEAVSYEIPAGKLEVGENTDPVAAALRELEEETTYTGKLELLYDFYSAIGFCNEKLKLYLASDLTKVENPRPQDEDDLCHATRPCFWKRQRAVCRFRKCKQSTITLQNIIIIFR